MPWIELFRTNFQGIIWGLRVSLPRGSPHLRLRSWWSKPYAWGVLRSSVARRKVKSFQRFAILLLACLVEECLLWEFSSFPLCISRLRNHSFHLFFLCPTTLASLILSYYVTQFQGTACSAAPLQSQHILRNKSTDKVQFTLSLCDYEAKPSLN